MIAYGYSVGHYVTFMMIAKLAAQKQPLLRAGNKNHIFLVVPLWYTKNLKQW